MIWLASIVVIGSGGRGGVLSTPKFLFGRGVFAFSTTSTYTMPTSTTLRMTRNSRGLLLSGMINVPKSRRSVHNLSCHHRQHHPDARFSLSSSLQVFSRNRSTRLFSAATNDATSFGMDLDELNAKIKAKGDEIRQLKADGTDKEALAPHVEELLALKAQLPPEDDSKPKISSNPKKSGGGGGNKQQQNNNNKKGGEGGNAESEPMTESEIKLVRLGKAQAMRDADVEPFAYTYDVTTSASKLLAEYDGKLEPGEEDEMSDVAVAGRILTRRVFGKLAFFTLQDESGIVQLQFDKKRLGDTFQGVKDWTDGGDIIGVRGSVRRTDKGELTVYAKEWTMLTKAILPLPDKFHGLQDVTKRYRSRHVDLIVNSEVRDTFRKRAKITSMLRRILDEMGFLEIETPVLHTQSGGAEAKPFETYHNSMDMDLTLRIATELHLKRLIIGGFDRVYEVGRIFRNEGLSTRHNPEFTSVELYQAYADYDDMMDLTENLVCSK